MRPALALLLFASPALALDATCSLSQLGHTMWTLQGGLLPRRPQAPGAIDAIVEDLSGTVWFTRADRQDGQGPVCEVKADQPLCHGKKAGIPVPRLRDLRLGPDGHFWSVSETTLMGWQPGSTSARTWRPPGISAGGERNALDVLQGVQPARDGSVWVAAMQPSRGLGLLRLADDRWQPFVIPGLDGRKLSVSSLLLDRQGALWIGTQDEGVYRLHGDNVSHYATGDGLSSNTVVPACERKSCGYRDHVLAPRTVAADSRQRPWV